MSEMQSPKPDTDPTPAPAGLLRLPADFVPRVSDPRLVLLLFGTAILVRLVAWAGLGMFGRDSTSFLFMADWMREGRFHDALALAYHPMYPLLIAVAATFTGSAVTAGHAVALVLGSAAVVPLFKLVQTLFGRPAAFFAGLFYVFSAPLVRVQSDVMTDGPFMFFFLAALWLTWRMAEEPSLEGAVVLGLTAAASFLTRPEGLISMVAAVAWPLIEGVRFGPSRIRRIAGTLLILATILVALSPYLFWVKSMRGRWGISYRPSALAAERSLGIDDPKTAALFSESGGEPSRYGRFGKVILRLNLYGALLPFHVLGLLSFRTAGWRRQGFFYVILLAYVAGVLIALRKYNAMSDRYLMPAMVWMSGLAGLGVARALQLAIDRWPHARWRPVVCASLLAAMTVVAGLKGLFPRNQEWRGLPVVGEWLRDHGAEARGVVSTLSQVNYFARSREIRMPETREELCLQIATPGMLYYVYTESDVRSKPSLFDVLRSCEGLQPPIEIEVPRGTEKVFVQRVR